MVNVDKAKKVSSVENQHKEGSFQGISSLHCLYFRTIKTTIEK